MDKSVGTELLFAICKEIKQFYEAPVIFVTEKDLSNNIFNTLCSLRTILLEGDGDIKSKIIDMIADFHLQWIQTVNDIEKYKKRLNDTPMGISRESVYQTICYTIDAMQFRFKNFQKYMENNRPGLSNVDHACINAELEIVEEMHEDVIKSLLQKLTCFRSFISDNEFKIHVDNAAEELLNWFDRINDNLALYLSKYVNVHVPHFTTDLAKALQQIIKDMDSSDIFSELKTDDETKQRGSQLGAMIRCTASRDLEMSKIVDKINILDDRIKRLELESTSTAVMALTQKKEYLENRLASLENLKINLENLHYEGGLQFEVFEKVPQEEICVCEDFFRFRIFNHSLPFEKREKLVTELCNLWNSAVLGDERSRKSIISILSAAENKEEFTDELGTFYIDEYSRKIYKLPDDDTLYQPNENNELVPLTDTAGIIFFYDECGRYYIYEKTRQRVYKAHATASEYMMDTSGVLLKTKEERDGIVYYYDSYGRYYINADGKNIYRESDTVSEYENDGLGNLVRIRSQTDLLELCPDDVNVTEDFKYLKQSVGPALRVCIAQCILHQPADPIKFLSNSLLKFRQNMEIKDTRVREKEALFAEREIIAAEEQAAAELAARELALLTQGGSECSFDSNLMKYTTENPADILSGSSK